MTRHDDGHDTGSGADGTSRHLRDPVGASALPQEMMHRQEVQLDVWLKGVKKDV